MSAKQSRTVRGWVVVNGAGHPLIETTRTLRRDAVCAYGDDDGAMYRAERTRYGIRAVRCTITTEPVKP